MFTPLNRTDVNWQEIRLESSVSHVARGKDFREGKF